MRVNAEPWSKHTVLGLRVIAAPEPVTQDDVDNGTDDTLSRCGGCVFNSPVYEHPPDTPNVYRCKVADAQRDPETGTSCGEHSIVWILPQQVNAYKAYAVRRRIIGE